MNFTTEIGRMRSEEMVNRGLRYQATSGILRRRQADSEPNADTSAWSRRPTFASLLHLRPSTAS
jgi:hypothetical protein